MGDTESELPIKREIFCQEYVVDFNATQAAIRAGYSEESAYSQGSRLLKDVEVKARIEKLKQEKLAALAITPARILEELGKMAFADPRKMFNADGSPKQITELGDNEAACISGFELTSTRTKGDDDGLEVVKKFKMTDKKGALELLGKHKKLFTDNVQHSNDPANPLPGGMSDTDLARAVVLALTTAAKAKEEQAEG